MVELAKNSILIESTFSYQTDEVCIDRVIVQLSRILDLHKAKVFVASDDTFAVSAFKESSIRKN